MEDNPNDGMRQSRLDRLRAALGKTLPSPLRLAACVLSVMGAIATLALFDVTSDRAILGAPWAIAAVVGWWVPLLAALVLIVLALLGLTTALAQAFLAYYYGGPSFGQCFFWEFLLPVATALLFVAAFRQRTGRPAMW